MKYFYSLVTFGGLFCSFFRVAAAGDIIMCNGNTQMSREFAAEMYRQYPVQRSRECDDEVGEEAKFSAQLIACGLAGLGTPVSFGCIAAVTVLSEDRRKRCKALAKRLYDQENSLNARIPPDKFKLPKTQYIDYYVNISASPGALHDFYGKGTKTLAWRSFTLASGSVKEANVDDCGSGIAGKEEGVDCKNSLLGLPKPFLDQPLSVDSNTLSGPSSASYYPDVQYSTELKNRISTASSRIVRCGGGWCFTTDGCTPQYVKVRVQWSKSTTDPILGKSVDVGSGGRRRQLLAASTKTTYTCWKRTIFITEVSNIEPSLMPCDTSFTSNRIKLLMASPNLQPDPRSKIMERIRTSVFASTVGGGFVIYFSQAFAKSMLDCVEPLNRANAVGGTWEGFAFNAAGTCKPCASASIMQKNNWMTKACNRTSPVEALLDCCFTCKNNYMPSSPSSVANGEVFSCIPACKPGQTLSAVGKSLCVACPVGKFSVGGQAPCEKCRDLGHENARADPLRGCISCGNRQAVDAAVGVKCIPCISGQQVLRESKCVECPIDQAYYIPELGTACVLCHRGTYKTPSGGTCAQCPQDTYNTEPGSTTCVICPSGTRSVPNRTVCAPCAAINRTLLPYSEYYEPGCRVRCKPGVSYLITNPYSIGGCGRCQDIVLPKGTRSAQDDCSVPVPCTNGPLNSDGLFFYNGSAAYGSEDCPWDCKAGFYRVNGDYYCRTCAVSSFDPANHVFTSHCEYACKPYVYADSSKACDRPCVDLLQEYDVKGLIHSRVREYTLSGEILNFGFNFNFQFLIFY